MDGILAQLNGGMGARVMCATKYRRVGMGLLL